jgi:hypothetical protein
VPLGPACVPCAGCSVYGCTQKGILTPRLQKQIKTMGKSQRGRKPRDCVFCSITTWDKKPKSNAERPRADGKPRKRTYTQHQPPPGVSKNSGLVCKLCGAFRCRSCLADLLPKLQPNTHHAFEWQKKTMLQFYILLNVRASVLRSSMVVPVVSSRRAR